MGLSSYFVPKPRPKSNMSIAPPRTAWMYVVLAAAVVVVYGQAIHFSFVNFDDPDYVTRNLHVRQGLTAAGVAWAVMTGYAANWFPLTWISHMLDCQLFGLDAGWHHLTNVVLHALATVLLFAFLHRATGTRWRSGLVTLLFAVHPLHVESVAWVAERKDTLNAVFWFLTLWAYVRYTERTTAGRYAMVAVCFALGLLTKPMIVTLPLVLLLVDVWPLGRGARIREKLPLLAMSVAGALVTFAVQQGSGAVKSLATFSLPLRIGNALVSYVIYLVKTVWPSGLAVFYPYPRSVPFWEAAACAAVLAGITAVVVLRFRSAPYLAAGWLWFLVTLLPVIGLVQVGVQARADRYMYVPMVGLAVMLAWGVREVAPRWRRMAGGIAVAACVAWGAVAYLQAGYWTNSETLFRHALDVTTDNALAEHNLGSALLEDPARVPEAIPHLEAALRLQPDSAEAQTDLGSALAKSGRVADAIPHFESALRLAPGSAIVHNDLGNALLAAGRLRESIAEYEQALKLEPEYAEARRNLAIAHNDLGSQNPPEAIAEYEASLRLDSSSAETHFNLGMALEKAGRRAEAIAQLEEAVRLKPEFVDAHNNLGFLLAQTPGRLREAIAQFEAAVRLKPDDADAQANLAMARSQLK
jgi:tetratricopeptide (TPR) repeat protein